MQDAWTQFVNRHAAVVVARVRRIVGNDHDTEDVVQVVFAEAWQVMQHSEVHHPAAFLRRLATRRAIDCLRKRASTPPAAGSDGDLACLPSTTPQPAEHAEAAELAERLRLALGTLPAVQARVFALRYFDELSYEQIAQELEMTTNAVGLAIHKARRRLQTFFAE